MKSHKIKPSEIEFAILAIDAVCVRINAGSLEVLLGKVDPQSTFKGCWALIGGLISPEETAEQAVGRHLKNKASIGTVYHEQLYTFSTIDRDPRGRVVSIAYLAPVHGDPQQGREGKVETRWFPVSLLPKLAYDHDSIIAVALERLRSKIRYTNIAQHLLPSEFTLSQLQAVYEVVLKQEVDKRNFRKKILATGLLRDTDHVLKEGVMRPAALYSFASKKMEVVEIM